MRPELQNTAEATEQLLKKARCVLTMGGEPTYLPLDPSGDEWNQAALGPTKLGYARKLALKLIETRFPGALIIQTYGKTYPGEALPRWNIVLETGTPKQPILWSRPELFASDTPPTQSISVSKVRSISKKLAQALELSDHLMQFKDASSTNPAFVLPLRFEGKSWKSCKWPLSSTSKCLIPGDSSAGLRLPLDRLPRGTPITALTIQAREGGIELFLPPLKQKAYLNLIATIEAVVTQTDLPERSLILCGYLSKDGNIENRILMASDPGVLEINLPPRKTWKDYVEVATEIDEAAMSVGLCTHKFHLNGTPHGTGGGAHLAFGGPTTESSPFLTNPTLLSSVIRYWNNHPSLSYLFTGTFVGPGSQAPRVDESNPLLLDELELALRNLEKQPKKADQDFDRIYLALKHFFVDAAGNTHRSEICLDKLWNLASPNGCLGIVEFRAFETMPQSELLTLHALFIRSILARLISEPYQVPIKRWGTSLHDQFFLKPFLEQDLKQISRDLKTFGLTFQPHWFQPTLDHRFPQLGILKGSKPSISINVYSALESWPLLSEVPSGSVTSRPVDVSNERLLITCGDLREAKTHYLRVAGTPVELRAFKGTAFRGIRYRSFAAHLSLHPYLNAYEPLQIEWVERKTGKIVSAIKRYSWNPKGRNYPNRPTGKEEAIQRFTSRWKPSSSRKKYPSSFDFSDSKNWTFDLRKG
ncbi:MAG: transglutaminase family protein [Verrucomicrobiota bacterium]